MREGSSADEDVSAEQPPSHLLRWLLACLALLIAFAVVPIRPETDSWALVLRWCITVAMLAALVILIRRQALRQISEADAPVGALVVGIVAGLLIFALIDYGVAVHRPGQFSGMDSRVDALYFALSTLLTVGFGDITADGQGARVLLCVQMAFNITAIAGSASLVTRRFTQRAANRAERRRGQ